MITYTLSTSEEELQQILYLQQRNLPASVSEEEQKTEGFVTVHHDFDTLKAMHDKCPHTIAKDGEKVIGYALSMHPNFGDSIAVLQPMFKQIENLQEKMLRQAQHDDGSFIVMGQICIDKTYRKQGVFRKLYETMQAHLIPPFSSIITEVDAKNERSLQAHYAVGFKELGRYTASGQQWVLIVLR